MLGKTLYGAIICFIVSTTHATTIEHFGYSLNTETNIVTGGGLEWLQWDETTQMKPVNALSSYGGVDGLSGGNWRIATTADIHSLFNNFFLSYDYTWELPSSIKDTLNLGGKAYSVTPANHFISLFGENWRSSGYSKGIDDKYRHSRAIFGCGDIVSNMCGRVAVNDAWSYAHNASHPGQAIRDRANLGSLDSFDGAGGIALVRSTSAVPLPAAGWLFISAIAALFMGNRKTLCWPVCDRTATRQR